MPISTQPVTYIIRDADSPNLYLSAFLTNGDLQFTSSLNYAIQFNSREWAEVYNTSVGGLIVENFHESDLPPNLNGNSNAIALNAIDANELLLGGI